MQKSTKAKLKIWLKKKITFRYHMFLIIMCTFLIGIITNVISLKAGMAEPYFRYPLNVFFSYLGFVLFIRFYLELIINRTDFDGIDPLIPEIDIPTFSNSPKWEGDGGSFSGGGASGSFGEDTSNHSVDISDAAGIGEDAIVVIILGAVLGFIIFGSGVYFIWHAPEILSEALIQILLVSRLNRKLKKVPENKWLHHILKYTFLEFLSVLVITLILGLYLEHACPGVGSLIEFKSRCWYN